MFRNSDKGTITYTLEVPIEQGALVDKALDKASAASDSYRAEFADESWSARRADAFLEIANAYLGKKPISDTASSDSDNYLVTVHVDHVALAEGKGRSGLPIDSVKRLCCDGKSKVSNCSNSNQKGPPCQRQALSFPGVPEFSFR